MKNIIFLFIIIIISSTFTLAAINPSIGYCEHMDYTIEENKCIFDEENNCPIEEFYSGICGQEFVKEFPCVQKGAVFPTFEQCCEGLESTNYKCGTFSCNIVISQSWCDEPVNQILGFTYLSIAILIIIIILTTYLILRHFKKK